MKNIITKVVFPILAVLAFIMAVTMLFALLDVTAKWVGDVEEIKRNMSTLARVLDSEISLRRENQLSISDLSDSLPNKNPATNIEPGVTNYYIGEWCDGSTNRSLWIAYNVYSFNRTVGRYKEVIADDWTVLYLNDIVNKHILGSLKVKIKESKYIPVDKQTYELINDRLSDCLVNFIGGTK